MTPCPMIQRKFVVTDMVICSIYGSRKQGSLLCLSLRTVWRAGQYWRKIKRKQREQKEGGLDIQSIFSFWTSFGASTNSRPLTMITAAVRALAIPQNNTYARVSVQVSPDRECHYSQTEYCLYILQSSNSNGTV